MNFFTTNIQKNCEKTKKNITKKRKRGIYKYMKAFKKD